MLKFIQNRLVAAISTTAEMVLITVNTPNIMKMFWTFQGRSLKPKFSFFGRRFFEDTSFSRATFYNKFWFSECNIGLKTNFNANFACDGIKNIDMCYRILKDVLSKEGYSIQARTIERLEQKIIDKQSKDDLLLSPTKPNIPNKTQF